MNGRGLPVERYSEDELRQIYFGIGANLGRPVFQNRTGELMRAKMELVAARERGEVGALMRALQHYPQHVAALAEFGA